MKTKGNLLLPMPCLVLKVIKKKPIGMTASITKALITTAQPIMKASIIKASVVKVPTTNVIITRPYMVGKAVIVHFSIVI